jgi:transposase
MYQGIGFALEVEFLLLMRKSVRANIVFIDESGILMSPVVRRSWSPKGCTPVFAQRARAYQKVSMIAAVTVTSRYMRTGLYFSLHSNRNVKTPQVIRFLKDLVRHIRGPIIIVWDRLLAHKAKAVERFTHDRARLAIHFFPAYAPELNPTEYLWAYLKNNPLANRTIVETQKLSQVTRYHSMKIRRHHKLLRSFLYASSLFCHK